ncbi:MAG: hypothetical protein ABIP02_00370, partial [Arenimonas sp.]
HFCFDDNRSRMTSVDFKKYLGIHWATSKIDSSLGLGLSWAESAITSMRGKLFVEPSQLMTGITIHLILPRAKIEAD